MSADLTRRLYAAAEQGTTREETVRAVCREAAEYLAEEAALFAARTTSPTGRPWMATDRAHHSVIDQISDLLARVGDERIPS